MEPAKEIFTSCIVHVYEKRTRIVPTAFRTTDLQAAIGVAQSFGHDECCVLSAIQNQGNFRMVWKSEALREIEVEV